MRVSCREFLRSFGAGIVTLGALGLAGCSEGLRGGGLTPKPSGISFWKRFVLAPGSDRPLRELRVAVSVDFRVGGDPVNAFNWVDGYPILQAAKFGQWSWGLATPTLFDVLDTRSPFGLDPDAFSFQDAQGEYGNYSATFVFRRPELRPGETWEIDLLYLCAEDDFALVHLYRQALETIEVPTPPDAAPYEPTLSPAPLADEQGRIQVLVDVEKLGFPVRRVEAVAPDLQPHISENPIYQEGIGIKYAYGYGKPVFLTGDEVETDRVEGTRLRLCGEAEVQGLRWSGCIASPTVWLSL